VQLKHAARRFARPYRVHLDRLVKNEIGRVPSDHPHARVRVPVLQLVCAAHGDFDPMRRDLCAADRSTASAPGLLKMPPRNAKCDVPAGA
jgi:hypothetical protein